MGFLHRTTRWQQKAFYKTLPVAAVNIEVVLGMKFPEFGKLPSLERRVQTADALTAAATSQRERDTIAVKRKKQVAREGEDGPSVINPETNKKWSNRMCVLKGCDCRNTQAQCRFCKRPVCYRKSCWLVHRKEEHGF